MASPDTLLLGWFLLFASSEFAVYGETCGFTCTDGNCKEISCLNGECHKQGNCACYPCYRGVSCEDYDDRSGPYFAKKDETIYIQDGQEGEVYLANAIDEDSFKQCMEQPSRPCPCSKVQYEIVGGTGIDKFSANKDTGQVSVIEGKYLPEGEEYDLVISVRPENRSSNFDSDSMRLRVFVQESEYSFSEKQTLTSDHEETNQGNNHIRIKRDSFGSQRSDLNLSLSIENTVTEPIKPGVTIKVKLEAILPTIASSSPLDLKIEIFTIDAVSGLSTMALCNLAIESIGAEIKDSDTSLTLVAGDITVSYEVNTELKDFHDRVVLDFGNLYNEDLSGGTDYGPSTIVITYDATGIFNPSYSNSEVRVTAGAEYDQGQKIWVSQMIGDFDPSINPESFTYKITFSGLDTIPQYSGGVFQFDAYVPYPYGKAMVEVFIPSEYHDQFSISSMKIIKSGSNHGCALGDGIPTYYKSITGRTNIRVTQEFTQLVQNVDYGNLAAESTEAENLLVVGFSGFFYQVLPGTIVTVGVGMTVDNALIWTALGNVTVGPPGAPPAANNPYSLTATPLDKSTGGNPKVAKNQAATWALKFDLPRAGNALIDCTVTPPDANHIVGGVQYGDVGYNVARLPDLPPIVVYANGGASFKVNVNTSITEGTADTTQDYVEFDVAVIYLGDTPGTVSVSCAGSLTASLTAEASGLTPTKDVDGTAILIGDDDNAYVGAQLGIEATLSFPANGVGYASVALESAGDFVVTDFGAEVCKVEVLQPGRGISSILLGASQITTNLQVQQTSTNSMFNDSAVVPIGAVASGIMTDGTVSDYEVKLRIYYDIPKPQTISSGDYNVSIGLLFDSALIWTGWAALNLESLISTYDPNKATRFLFHPPLAIPSQSTVIAKVYAKMYPGINSILKYTFTSPDTTLMKICKVVLINVGSNFACMDKDIYGRENDPTATITAVPDATDPNKQVVLDFGVTKNFATSKPTTYEIPDANSIEVGVIMSVSADTTLQISAEDGRTTPLAHTMTLTTAGTATQSDTALTFNVTGIAGANLDFYDNVMKEIDLNLIIPPGFHRTVKIQTNNVNHEEMSICYAHFIKAGLNIPCLDPKFIFTTNETGVNGEDVYKIDLGLVSHYPVSEDINENLVVVRVGALVNEGTVSTSFEIIIEDKDQAHIVVVSLASAGAFVLGNDFSCAGLDMIPLSNETQLVEPGMKYWTGVKISLPEAMTLPLEIGVLTFSSEGHATATVHDIQFGTLRGFNIGCLTDIDKDTLKFQQNSSTDGIQMIHESQYDVLMAEPIYITNTGITTLIGREEPEANFFSVEAQVLIADHDAISNGDLISVGFALRIGDEVIAVADVNLTLVETGSEIMELEANFSIVDEKSDNYKQKDQIQLTGSIKHVENVSQVEAYDAKIRILMPSYLVYVNTSDPATPSGLPGDDYSVNVTSELIYNNYADIDIDYLFFTDYIEFNISVSVDPYEQMPLGLEALNSSILMRFICKKGSPIAATEYCTPTKYVNFVCEGSGCALDLLTETFEACQFSASTAIEESVGPEKVVTSGGWSPVVRSGSNWAHHVTIDFLRKTRVTKIVSILVPNKNSIKEFELQYSMDGKYFIQACPQALPTANSILPKECEVISRYVRIVILSLVETDETIPIGVSLKFYGCYKETVNGTCTLPSTPFGNTIANWRHVAAGNGIAYFCDKTPKRKEPYCYSSSDGTTWHELPSYIGELAGYDSTQVKMYAYDLNKSSVVASSDGIAWELVSEIEKAALSLNPPQSVKGDGATAVGTVPMDGDWVADFHGIKYQNVYKTKWDSCCG